MPPRRRRRRRHVGRKTRLTISLSVLFTILAIVVPALHPEPPRMLVDGKRVAVRSKVFTVGDALESADVKLEAGPVYSVRTHTLLGNDGPMPRLMLNGQVAHTATVVYSGDNLQVVPVTDTVERIVSRRSADLGALPDVEKTLFHRGRGAVAEQTVGERSGEVLSEKVVQPAVPGAPVTEKVVALTFDDGPDPTWTPQVLDILKGEGVVATFCMVGYLVERHPDLAKRVAAEGHLLCNHTAGHNAALDTAPREKVVSEVNGGADMLKNVTGVDAAFYRPPGGRLSPTVIEVVHARGERVLHWAVDTADYTKPPAATIVARVMANASPGAVILMHDGGGDRSQTVAAVRSVIQGLRSEGYGFATPASPPPVAGV